MQVLLAWKSKNLNETDACQRWDDVVNRWKTRYQALVDQELHLATTHTGELFTGLLYIPEMFLDWQEFYDDEHYSVAWAGIAYNLIEHLPFRGGVRHMQAEFIAELQKQGTSLLQALNGRFVVSILNRKTKDLRIFTAGDGLTPGFRTQDRYGVAVGTRIAPLLDLVGKASLPNRMALIQMFTTEWCLGSHTAFEGVFQINPGMELRLQDHASDVQEQCYFPPQEILTQAKTLKNEDYLRIASDTFTASIRSQMRHSRTPLMNLTGGMDSRSIVASVIALGYHPECDVSGVPDSQDIAIAAQVAKTAGVSLHCLHPEKHYTEHIDDTLRQWIMWTEGMAPICTAFARSAFALSPERRIFFAQYCQRFSGLGGFGRSLLFDLDLCVSSPSQDEIIERLFKRFGQAAYIDIFTEADRFLLKNTIREKIFEASELGLSEAHERIDYFYWQERVNHWGGYALDMQQFGRHVFAPFCQSLLYAAGFSLTLEEKLSAAWYYYHLARTLPSLLTIPFLSPPPLSGLRKRLLDIHPALYNVARNIRQQIGRIQPKTLPIVDQEMLVSHFHPYLQRLLFSGDNWWSTVIDYEKGRKMWDNFVQRKEAKALWKLATLELWARNFLS